MAKYFTALVYLTKTENGQQLEKWVKYHNIKNDGLAITKFVAFIESKFPQARYINFYDKHSRRYHSRRYIQNQQA